VACALLALEGCIVTLDAMGVSGLGRADGAEGWGGSAICLKGNQETLDEAAKAIFAGVEAQHAPGMPGSCVDPFEGGPQAGGGEWSLGRVRQDHTQQNMAMMRRLALSLLKQDTQTKAGIAARRKKAGWDHDYLLALLTRHS
jgi:predicted transposase YbfD/YdcC